MTILELYECAAFRLNFCLEDAGRRTIFTQARMSRRMKVKVFDYLALNLGICVYL
jgi:hypothetical protein